MCFTDGNHSHGATPARPHRTGHFRRSRRDRVPTLESWGYEVLDPIDRRSRLEYWDVKLGSRVIASMRGELSASGEYGKMYIRQFNLDGDKRSKRPSAGEVMLSFWIHTLRLDPYLLWSITTSVVSFNLANDLTRSVYTQMHGQLHEQMRIRSPERSPGERRAFGDLLSSANGKRAQSLLKACGKYEQTAGIRRQVEAFDYIPRDMFDDNTRQYDLEIRLKEALP